jgi:lipoyl(octanoyl) transferase
MITEWRLIESGPCDASYNMALDEAIAAEVRRGSAPPTLRIYTWNSPSVTVGCFQKIRGIDTAYCKEHSIPIVRRPTGGRALLHCEELTYSFSARIGSGPFSHGLLDSYKQISTAFSMAFRNIGIAAEQKQERETGRTLSKNPLCFQSSSFGEILLDRKKLMGSAQKRWSDGLLQQGSIPYLRDEENTKRIFGTAETVSLGEHMKTIKEILPSFDEGEFKEAIALSFEKCFGIRLIRSVQSEEEDLLAGELLDRKYLRSHWNFRD